VSQPRIRTIKPDLWDDEILGHCSVHARLLFIGLISNADDDGRLRGAASRIGGRVFQYDEFTPKRVDGWLRELENGRLIVRYEVEKQRFIYLPSFSRHQVINKRRASTLPPPPPEFVDPATGEIRDEYRTPTGTRPQENGTTPVALLHGSGSGMERKG
jgi:hypothetical protein